MSGISGVVMWLGCLIWLGYMSSEVWYHQSVARRNQEVDNGR